MSEHGEKYTNMKDSVRADERADEEAATVEIEMDKVSETEEGQKEEKRFSKMKNPMRTDVEAAEDATIEFEVDKIVEIKEGQKEETGCNKCKKSFVEKVTYLSTHGYTGETSHSGLRLRRGQGFEEDQVDYEEHPTKSVLPADKRKAGMEESFGDKVFTVMNECLIKLPKEIQQGLFDMMPEKITDTKGGFQQVC